MRRQLPTLSSFCKCQTHIFLEILFILIFWLNLLTQFRWIFSFILTWGRAWRLAFITARFIITWRWIINTTHLLLLLFLLLLLTSLSTCLCLLTSLILSEFCYLFKQIRLSQVFLELILHCFQILIIVFGQLFALFSFAQPILNISKNLVNVDRPSLFFKVLLAVFNLLHKGFKVRNKGLEVSIIEIILNFWNEFCWSHG